MIEDIEDTPLLNIGDIVELWKAGGPYDACFPFSDRVERVVCTAAVPITADAVASYIDSDDDWDITDDEIEEMQGIHKEPSPSPLQPPTTPTIPNIPTTPTIPTTHMVYKMDDKEKKDEYTQKKPTYVMQNPGTASHFRSGVRYPTIKRRVGFTPTTPTPTPTHTRTPAQGGKLPTTPVIQKRLDEFTPRGSPIQSEDEIGIDVVYNTPSPKYTIPQNFKDPFLLN